MGRTFPCDALRKTLLPPSGRTVSPHSDAAPRLRQLGLIETRYGRSVVIASKASQTATTRAPSGISSSREPVRVAAAVPALVARAHEPRDRAQRRRLEQDALADQWMAPHEAPLDRVERAGLVEDGVRNGDLADVAELRGPGHLVEALRAHVQFAPDRQRKLPDVTEPQVKVGAPLGESPQQDVAGLAPSGHPAPALARVHAPVCELQGLRGRGGLLGEADRPE